MSKICSPKPVFWTAKLILNNATTNLVFTIFTFRFAIKISIALFYYSIFLVWFVSRGFSATSNTVQYCRPENGQNICIEWKANVVGVLGPTRLYVQLTQPRKFCYPFRPLCTSTEHVYNMKRKPRPAFSTAKWILNNATTNLAFTIFTFRSAIKICIVLFIIVSFQCGLYLEDSLLHLHTVDQRISKIYV